MRQDDRAGKESIQGGVGANIYIPIAVKSWGEYRRKTSLARTLDKERLASEVKGTKQRMRGRSTEKAKVGVKKGEERRGITCG